MVADASIVLAFIMHDENEAYADAAVSALADAGGVVPANFQSEVANALLQAVRRRRIGGASADAALTEILALPLAIENVDPHAAMRLAREHRLTCYDGFYLALAEKLDVSLATLDVDLSAAATALRRRWQPPA